MKKNVILFSVFLILQSLQAQIEFEKGYFINNANKKTECLIKNVDWKNNPKTILYKLQNNSEVLTNTIDQVKEFGYDNGTIYKRFKVKIDRSNPNITSLETGSKPKFKEEVVFLRMLRDANINLYEFQDGEYHYYFYQKANETPVQLIFKKYKTLYRDPLNPDYAEEVIKENKYYIFQLKELFKDCRKLSEKDYDILYKKKPILHLFDEYYACSNMTHEIVKRDHRTLKFEIWIDAGMRSAETEKILNIDERKVELTFPRNYNFVAGAHFDYILPFNKNSWAVFSEWLYNHYQAEITDWKIDYKALEIGVGVKYRFFFFKESDNPPNFFIKTAIFYNHTFDSSKIFDYTVSEGLYPDGISTPLSNYMFYSFGFGVNYKRYSISLNLNTDRDLFSDYQYRELSYKSFDIKLSYRIK